MSEVAQAVMGQAGLFLFLTILAEQIGLPVIATPVLLGAGALAGQGELSVTSAILITVAACGPGDLIWYYAGRRRGERVTGFARRTWSGFDRCERLFGKYGLAAVAAAKFIPGAGFLIPALAGAFKISFRRFMWFDVLGSFLYAIFYIELGVIFQEEIYGAIRSVGEAGVWVSAGTALAIGACAAIKLVQRQRKATMAPAKI